VAKKGSLKLVVFDTGGKEGCFNCGQALQSLNNAKGRLQKKHFMALGVEEDDLCCEVVECVPSRNEGHVQMTVTVEPYPRIVGKRFVAVGADGGHVVKCPGERKG